MIKRVNRLRRGLAGVLAGVFVVGAAALVVAPAAPAQAAMPNSWGFGYLDNPAPVLPYNLPPATESSSSGLGAQLTGHSAVGFYQVTFFDIGTPAGAAPGVVHVTAAPAKQYAAWCQARSWGSVNGNEVVNIVCYRAPGAVRVNTDFSVAFSWSTQPAPAGALYGYLESTGVNGTVTQFDSAAGLITSTLAGTGLWHVVMPNLGGPGPQTGGIQVTPVGTTPQHCKVRNWNTTAAVESIYVMCFTPAGAPVNLPWNLTYQNRNDITGRAPLDFAYIWNTVPPPPPATTNFNSCMPGPVNTVTPGPAPYKVTFPCVFAPPTNVLLSASGANHDFCSLTSPGPWANAGPAVIVPNVRCFHLNSRPSPADGFFATYTSG
jgi:hypothetical protein